MAKDLGKELKNIEGLKDKSFTILGMRMTPTTLLAAFAGIGSIIGALYAGFLMYQKIEEVADLDIEHFQVQMDQINIKIDANEKLLKSMESNLNDAKINMYRIDTKVSDKLDSYDTKLDRFENKVEKTKINLEDKIQKALNNPLNE